MQRKMATDKTCQVRSESHFPDNQLGKSVLECVISEKLNIGMELMKTQTRRFEMRIYKSHKLIKQIKLSAKCQILIIIFLGQLLAYIGTPLLQSCYSVKFIFQQF